MLPLWKAQCSYTTTEEDYKSAMTALQQKLESVSSCFLCGDLLFDDDHHLSKIILQRKALTCQLLTKKGYYNNNGRKLKLKSLCYHCGESDSTSFVFGLEELQEKSLSVGHKCYLIRADCTTDGKDVVKHGKQDKMQAQK